MAKSLEEWVDTDVRKVKDKPVSWLSQHYFFRDPIRPLYSDASKFFSPADGIILYQKKCSPDEEIIDIKGVGYTLQDAMRDPDYNQESLVIGIFMTFYDVHINRMPYPGILAYQKLEKITSHNFPMLEVEKDILEYLQKGKWNADYMYNNERVINKIFAANLRQHYYVLQIADFDVDVILPFKIKQNMYYNQNERFSVVRYGSQVELIIPLSKTYDFNLLQKEKSHVEAGIDPLIEIVKKSTE